MKNFKTYAFFILSALGVGGLSALLTAGSMEIYKEVTTPPLSPPSVLFPIVWTVLYVLMGVCAAWVYLSFAPEKQKRSALVTYGISLLFNFLWSIFFFRLRLFLFSFFWLLGLLFLILKTVADYRDISPKAAYLQIPYALWVTFAGYLNFGIWFLNR